MRRVSSVEQLHSRTHRQAARLSNRQPCAHERAPDTAGAAICDCDSISVQLLAPIEVTAVASAIIRNGVVFRVRASRHPNSQQSAAALIDKLPGSAVPATASCILSTPLVVVTPTAALAFAVALISQCSTLSLVPRVTRRPVAAVARPVSERRNQSCASRHQRAVEQLHRSWMWPKGDACSCGGGDSGRGDSCCAKNRSLETSRSAAAIAAGGWSRFRPTV
jgi:hypothetical protein